VAWDAHHGVCCLPQVPHTLHGHLESLTTMVLAALPPKVQVEFG
jgi:hypothetical protein